MSSEVSVHVRIGTLRLDYRGARAFYERNVESLVAAASRQEAPTRGAAVETASEASVEALPPPVDLGDAEAAAPVASPAPAAAVPTREAYEPQSPEFGRYVRRLGPDADAPDRHVVAFAFYLRNYERRETFGMDEIEGCLHAIGRTLPDDGPAIFADLTDNKRFLEAAGERAWRLSKKGENYVKTRLLTV
jgi:hypothetical protein